MLPRRLRPKIVPKNCPYCKTDTEPHFRDYESLRRYLSERGKILAHMRTGICSKHQRHIALSIKHARYLALLPFINRG
ncbi:MAG: 30S ribosomal protein S18 [Candidatus Gottesmanbacteria bacterium GW2011_GWB1_43_11]|uniref:Small ribosomal subunit protein bS18 n=1 Tax=Candidatus Gottesmanbacteria bacterium GW2011_GWB1_43_11 TaxID=1618446 RepID=A0A0G1CMC8_9BACT|nr:MAG: 30S ribosomal protein S18 [Candidatus Gottesmanbacteria bacterium GW2011_GWA2_42_16]KKS54936.1 MAG: 30S ribosomal protein S18 [Candidatus Gottesmanbacteria bacterium GW2011_GWA1_42_26]KKS82126.1 MAG: hypothetical protein UV55_C0005G0044 [Candidatus Gottesmanbacteria bacterium GW2011_GWC1_43_10]KKS86642.1 MAG: 30S ribosomal protein S18 [Candidatus Gottesmanbacteria bacterium GW2011_GWB1_43_11]HCM37836.1 30S ribosomal protein S18 [Patescibacteria group bacterium]